jgi:pilus assembly protein CpaD
MFKRSFPLLAAAALPLLASGCMGTQNRGLESVHQPVVSRADYALDLAVDASGLARGETRRLAGWADTMRLGYGDQVSIDDPAHSPRVRAQVAAAIGEHGLLLAAEAPPVDQPLSPGTVRVVVSRMRAAVPGCPDWSRDSGTEFNSNTSSNHGCATNGNLAAMVANPADLVRGQSGDSVNDPVSSYRAIDAYRKATPTGSGSTAVKASALGGK